MTALDAATQAELRTAALEQDRTSKWILYAFAGLQTTLLLYLSVAHT